MGIWGVLQIIGVAWFAASVVIAIAWALVGRRIFRKPPVQPTKQADGVVFTGDFETDRRQLDRYRGGER